MKEPMQNPLVYITYHASSGPCGLLLLGKTPIAGTYDDDDVTYESANNPSEISEKISLLEIALSEALARQITCVNIPVSDYDINWYNLENAPNEIQEEDIFFSSKCLLVVGLFTMGEIVEKAPEENNIFDAFEKSCDADYDYSYETDDTPTSKGVSVVQGVFIAGPAEPKKIEIIEEFPEYHVDAMLEDYPTSDLLDEISIRNDAMVCSLTDEQIATVLFNKGFDDTPSNIKEVKYFLASVVNPEHYLRTVEFALTNLSIRYTLDKL